MKSRLNNIESQLMELRNQLTHHSLYHELTSVNDIKLFMEKHVYAVWDFMSLLKALQQHLTCTTLPWKPVKNPKTARFINEIVWGEESDVNENNEPKSHFEMYIEAMDEVDADHTTIETFINEINNLDDIQNYINQNIFSKAVSDFLMFTFETIQTNQPHKIAAAFTFGREDVIPDMFLEIINGSNATHQNQYPKLKYYLERHIEIDGDEHGPLSLEMISELCEDHDQKWQEVEEISKIALQHRIALWDEIVKDINKN